MGDHMDFRDVVHATQAQMLDQFGDNVFKDYRGPYRHAARGPGLHVYGLDRRG